jgi:hypothetical protein
MFAFVSENVYLNTITYLNSLPELTNCPLIRFSEIPQYLVTSVSKPQTQEMNKKATFISKIISVLTRYNFLSFRFLQTCSLTKHNVLQPVHISRNKINPPMVC